MFALLLTHDCARGMPRPSIAVSPSLCRLVVDRRLFAVVNRVYQPRPHRSPSSLLCCCYLAASSATPSSVGLLNARSVCNKAALIHDVITDNRLDILILTETWIPSDTRTPSSSMLRRQVMLSFTAIAQRPLSDTAVASPLFTATPSGRHQLMSAISLSLNHSL